MRSLFAANGSPHYTWNSSLEGWPVVCGHFLICTWTDMMAASSLELCSLQWTLGRRNSQAPGGPLWKSESQEMYVIPNSCPTMVEPAKDLRAAHETLTVSGL